MLAAMPRKSRRSTGAGPQASLHQHKNHKVPNLYWRSVSTDNLRRNERFMGLPPVAHLEQPSQPPNHRYVRQESALWRQLHDGLLTTGLVKAALGLHDPKQAQVVGIHPGSRGSSHLLSAYFHLLAASSSSSSSGDGGAAAAAAAAAAANEASRQQYNQPAAVAARAVAVAPSVEELQATCERTALAGDLAVKLAWGKVQEGAALFALLQLFPDALLEEVGLFQVDLSQLPASWRPELNASSLPGLGASPDGLILHRVALSAADLQATAATLQQQEQQQGQGQEEVPGLSLHVLQQQAVQGLLRAALDRVVCTGQRPRVGVPLASSSDEEEPRQGRAANEEEEDGMSDDGDGTAAAAGREAEASSSSSRGDDDGSIAASLGLQQLSLAEEEAGSSSSSSSSGGSSSSNGGSGGSSGLPAERGAMPTAEAAGGLVFAPVAAALLELLGRESQWGSSGSRVATTGEGAAASSSGVDSQQAVAACEPGADVTLYVREVLEVKNHCPFQFRSKTRGKKGRTNVAFGFRARGPAQRLQAQWVPQLQLHMLATGCESALLASRCPHVGMRVYRLWRDDLYIFSMLRVLSLLQTQHVQSGVPPKADAFSKLPGYRAFVHRTAKLARAAVCIAAVGEEGMQVPAAADGSNVPKFWSE